MKSAVITGVAGQDGSYLSEYLVSLGYKIYGVTRRHSADRNYSNLSNIMENENFNFIEGDITDPSLVHSIVSSIKPNEWYNLAAQSNVGHSFKEPTLAFDTNAKSVITQLDMLRKISPETRFYQASTSELWGGLACPEGGYHESLSFHPRSPYGIAKLSAYWVATNYKEAYGMYTCNGILHNHSSPRRGLDFATRKITRGIAKVKLGSEKTLKMGNLSAFRDEGHSKDYCRAMHLMLQQEVPKDYVIATGDGATIEEMFRYVCDLAELSFEDVYELDKRFLRPSEVPVLLGDPTLAKEELGWTPKYTWKSLLKEMYENDLKELQEI